MVIEAEQWYPGQAVEGVVEVRPRVIYSRDGKYYYVEGGYGEKLPSSWLAVDPSDAPQGDCLPFAFWEVKAGTTRPVAWKDELADRYVAHEGWDGLPASHGAIGTLEGKMLVNPGDWIITGVKGEKYPCKPGIFAATYEPVEAAAGTPAGSSGVADGTETESAPGVAAPKAE